KELKNSAEGGGPSQQQKLRVCEMHLGYLKIRDLLKELREKHKDRRSDSREGRGYQDRDRDRGYDRDNRHSLIDDLLVTIARDRDPPIDVLAEGGLEVLREEDINILLNFVTNDFKMDTSTTELSSLDRLRIALLNLESIPAHKIPSPPYQQRRASVAIIIRIKPNLSYYPHNYRDQSSSSAPISSSLNHLIESSNGNLLATSTILEEFWKLPWVAGGEPEILYIKRALREGDRWSGQMAFPGGKQEPKDADDLDTAERETFEEVGLDLGDRKLFLCVGALDDCKVTTTFGKQLLMILCPYVFLQLTQETPPIEISGSEVESTHWIPLSIFFNPHITQKWNPASIDLSSRIAPKSWIFQCVLKTFIGRMHFHCIDLPQFTPSISGENNNRAELSTHSESHVGPITTLRLWGLTLQMTSDLIDMMYKPNEVPPRRLDAFRPRFDYWDVNFFSWLFLKSNRGNYRRQQRDFASRRTIWADGWSDYYRALQKSIIIAIITRTLIILWLLRKSPIL
ncbi:599_t:CDS:2, partial [Dentiscutata heterogama]